MAKAPKSARKFAASGQLKKKIQARHKHQELRKKIQSRKRGSHKSGGRNDDASHAEDEEIEDAEMDAEEDVSEMKKGKRKMTVDDFLSGGFMQEDGSDSEDLDEPGSDDEEDEEEEDASEDNFSEVDDLDDAKSHFQALSELATKDPEFYQFLKENDKELLEFDPADLEAEGNEGDDDLMDVNNEESDEEEEVEVPTLTLIQLKKWQRALLEQNSLRALRQLLIAFRSAAHMNEDDVVLRWKIDSSAVYNKLVTTAFRYTPVVLSHHIPYKTSPSGKIKPPSIPARFSPLIKLVLSYFTNATHLLGAATERETLVLALRETAKILPWVVSGRRAVRAWIKKSLELWSTNPHDEVRIAAILAVRKVVNVGDESLWDLVLKNAYLTLVRSSKSTSVHTLPALNLMKNSASELFCLDHAAAYQHAFTYVRQLAIHLRNSMKVKTKESYKLVYNWQYAHSVDLWCLVLAQACSESAEAETGKESALKPIIYPLVQVSLGAIRLISNARSFPFHLQILRSLLHLTRHTQVYVPLSAYLLPVIAFSLASPSGSSNNKMLKQLDMESIVRAPNDYVKTRVYNEGLAEECVWILGEWLSSDVVHGSVGFPELVVPVTVSLRKMLKTSASSKGKGKSAALVKGLVERIEEASVWVANLRRDAKFGPKQSDELAAWEATLRDKLTKKGKTESPLLAWLRVKRKERGKRREMLDKAREGKGEIVGEEGELSS